MIHQWSPRANAPFIVVSAATNGPERVEEELFGVETEGVARPGLLEQAHGGTLFLDEIADMPLTTQGKILRVLTDQSYTRVGGQRPVKVDVRVLSATSRNLADEIAGGAVPRGPVLSPQRRARAHPAAARAARGHSRAGQPLPRPVRGRAADVGADLVRRGDGRAPGPRLARQRPPVAQHHRADDHPRAGRPGRADRGRPASARSARPAGQRRRDQRDHDDHGQPAARGAGSRSSANICGSRSGVSRATSRAPLRSSAWSGPRCTAN